MSELEKHAGDSIRDKARFDLAGAAIVFVFVSGITVVTLLIMSWWLQ